MNGTGPGHPRIATTAVAVATVAVVTLGVAPATAAPDPPTSSASAPAARVTLLAQPAWTPVGGTVSLRLRIDGNATGLVLRVTVHSAVTSRSAFARTLNGQGLGGIVATTTTPVAALPADASGRVLTLGLQDPGAARDPSRLPVAPAHGSGEAVLPVEVELRDAARGTRLDGFVTHLVVVSGASSAGLPIELAWVWRIAGPPAAATDARPTRSALASFEPDGRLGTIAAALAEAPDVPVTLAPGPETLETWAAQAKAGSPLATGIDAIRTAARLGTNQLVSGPYVAIDGRALETAGLGGEIAAALAQGDDSLGAALGTQIDPRTVLADPLDPSVLERLREAGVFRVVVDGGALAPITRKFTLAQPFALESQGRTFDAAATDPALGALLTGSGPPALQAQHFLAALAVIEGEQPNQRRGVVVAAPAGWSPSRELLSAVLAGLRGNPLVHPVRLETLLDSVPKLGGSEHPTVREIASSPPGPALAVTARAFHDAESRLDAFVALVGPGDARVARGRRALLASLSSAFTGAAGRRRASEYLAAIGSTIAGFVARVHTPGSRSVTLTARRAAIPVSFQNDTGELLRVRVSLTSDRLLFPDGASRLLDLPPHNTTVRFTVETRTSGTFPLTISVTSVDGRIAFSPARVTVHSTVVSDVGLFLTVGAGVFLAVWWLTHTRRRRRARARGVHATGHASRSLAAGPTIVG